MNDSPENETEAIRSEIDTTRRRMDDTMDALGDRLKGRHLLDEILGFFRSDRAQGKAAEIRDKVSTSASSAVHSITDTVKANPVPLLLIGAGVAWMIYSSRKNSSSGYGTESYGSANPYDPDAEYDEPLEYPSEASSERTFGETEETGFTVGGTAEEYTSGESGLQQVKVGLQDKASEAAGQVKQKLRNAGNQVREKTQAATQRAREAGSRVQARTREVYVQTRTRVVTTADQHPLEMGLACLAAGVAAGLALPTPEKVNQLAGPAMERVRERTREARGQLMEKGKRVVSAATSAVKSEAETQGWTLEGLRQKAGTVADRAKEAAGEAAQREGLTPEAAKQSLQNIGGQSGGSSAAGNAGRGI